MAVARGNNFHQIPIKIVGSSKFGVYPKINEEHTYNMFESDNALIQYPGYKIGISSLFLGSASEGRAVHNSVKLNKIFTVFGDTLYAIEIIFDQKLRKIEYYQIETIGQLQTGTGICYISENNKPQIVVSDNTAIYVYDTQLSAVDVVFTVDHTVSTSIITLDSVQTFIVGEPVTLTTTGSLPTGLSVNVTYYISSLNFSMTDKTISLSDNPTDAYLGTPAVTFSTSGTGVQTLHSQGKFQKPKIDFKPGYLSFHDTYILAAARDDQFYSPAANNTWRISAENNALIWPNSASSIGLIETKPDNTQAVLRFPSMGNMIFVMGQAVTESWFDQGNPLFPYARNNQQNIDYGCINPSTVAYLDNYVVWFGVNEQTQPFILASDGGIPKKISTDGMNYLFYELQNPYDCQGFLFRLYGHLFYHINFYSDNRSFFYDFTTDQFYDACDENFDYYKMRDVVFYGNQYYAISKDDGNLYIFDTEFHSYQTVDELGNDVEYEIPRIRTTGHLRLPSQDYFILNDFGFTIESGQTNYHYQEISNQDETGFTLITVSGDTLITVSGDTLVTTQSDTSSGTSVFVNNAPRVDVAVSYDGGATFGNYVPYVLNPIGQRRNRLKWWQGGATNDSVLQFRFVGFGRIVALDGEANVRI